MDVVASTPGAQTSTRDPVVRGHLAFSRRRRNTKMDMDASNMDQEWAERPDEVMAYCIRDAELPLDILQAIQAVRRKEAVAAVAKVPFETAANGSTSQLVRLPCHSFGGQTAPRCL